MAGLRDINIAGNITGAAGGIQKNGISVLTLSGTNSYANLTRAQGGVLRLNSANAVPGGIGATGGTSAMIINTGIFGLGHGDFTRSLKAGVDGLTFASFGGWAAYGADRVVNLGGAGAAVTWGTATTGFNGQIVDLGHATSTHTVDLLNPIDLGNAARTIRVNDGSATIDGELSGDLTGVAGGNLVKGGAGTLLLSGTNDYAGATVVNQGLLRVEGTHTGTGAVTVALAGHSRRNRHAHWGGHRQCG